MIHFRPYRIKVYENCGLDDGLVESKFTILTPLYLCKEKAQNEGALEKSRGQKLSCHEVRVIESHWTRGVLATYPDLREVNCIFCRCSKQRPAKQKAYRGSAGKIDKEKSIKERQPISKMMGNSDGHLRVVLEHSNG